MNRRQKQLSNTAPRRWAMAGLLLGLFLFVLAMTQSESLHHLVHVDSKQTSHQCAVTMLRGGQVDAPPPSTVSIPVPQVVAVVVFTQPSAIFVSFDFTLLPSCGPPALLS
jgi:hypothetical protein